MSQLLIFGNVSQMQTGKHIWQTPKYCVLAHILIYMDRYAGKIFPKGLVVVYVT